MKLTKILALLCGLSLLAQGEDKKEPEAEEKGMPPFTHSFVCLKKATLPEQEEVEKAFREAFVLGKDEYLEVEIEANAKEEGETEGYGITVSFDENNFIVARSMGFAVPKSDIEYACMNSFYWPEAADVLKQSKDHLVVMAINEAEKPKDRALFLGRTLAALANSTDSLAVYYGTGDIVHEPKTYTKLISDKIEEAGDVPAMAWVGFLRSSHKNGTTSFYTRGLSEFGCKEVEVVKSDKNPSEIFELLFGLSQYLIWAGDVIADGDTVGGTEEEKIKVHLKKSQLDRDKVLRVDF